MKIVTSILLLCLFAFVSCSEKKPAKFDFLIGTWKIEGKQKYERWEKGDNNELKGSSYKIEKEQKTIWETLSIRQIDGKTIYEATVANQNDGKTIQFVLNEEIEMYFSFENKEHDFPKKIQYKIVAKDKVEVSVLGNKDEGFSYFMIKG